MASLTIVVEGVEQRVPLEAAAVTLGRGLESDVRLKDIKASRRHCQVVKTGRGYQCVDLSSGNGTYINGVQIKQQSLNPGDKITIGSTTILFEDAPKGGVSSKTATAKMPVASASSSAKATEDKPAPVQKATSKVATARVPVAPTKRTTERVEAAARPASQGSLKPATQPLSKSGSRVGKPTGRAASARAPRAAASAEAPAKKKSPVLLIAAAALVVLLAGGGWFLFGARDHGDQAKDQIEQLMKKGDAAAEKDHPKEALVEYRKALDLCQGDRHKMRASDLTKRIAQMEGRLAPPKPPDAAQK